MVPDLDLAIRGATVVTADNSWRANIGVIDGRIVHLGPDTPDATEVVDADGLLLMPGMVDTHVHLMDPGAPEREDFPTGTSAAAANGVTTLIEHTHGHPVREVSDLVDKERYLRGRSHVDFGLAAHAWPDRLDQIPALWQAGVSYFKLFTCATHGIPGFTPAELLDAFGRLAAADANCLVHCEDDSITAAAELALRASGMDDGSVIPRWRSREAELVATSAAAILARCTGARATVAHVSYPGAAELIVEERLRGADIVAEGCPQYFLLREDEVHDCAGFRKFTPPARARNDDDEDRMWRLLRTGVLNHISTDHAPATKGQKTEGDIWTVHFGLPGLDTTLRLLLDAAHRQKLSMNDVVRVYSTNPAKRYGLWPRKGSLSVGADADMVLVDPDAVGVISDDDVISKAGWTPYAGREVHGAVGAVYSRGRVIARNRVVTGPPEGQFLPGPGATGPVAW